MRRFGAESRAIMPAMPLTSAEDGHCSARLISRRDFTRRSTAQGRRSDFVPEVKDYPQDKIEIVAPVRLKDHFRVHDGDRLTLEFFN